MSTHKVWVVSELYYPEETSTGYLLTRIAEGLAQQFPVNVLCGQPSYAVRGTQAPTRQEHNQTHIQRVWSTTLNKNILPLRLINLLTISLSIFITALRQFNAKDVVLVVTNPPLLPFLVTIAAHLRKAKCLLLIHDVYPEVLIATGMTANNSLLARTINWLTSWLYKEVDQVIVLGRDMKQLANGKVADQHAKVVIIPNWADMEIVDPAYPGENPLLEELGLKDKFVVQYAGNMGRTHGLETLLESARRVENENIHFLFIGSGAKKEWLEQKVEEYRLSNVTISPYRPRSQQRIFIHACDIAIISFIPGMAGVSVPSRMYNILAAGKPILAVADEESELAQVVKEEGVGWVAPPMDVESVVAFLREAKANPDQLAAMGKRARVAVEDKYSFQHVQAAYTSLVNRFYSQQDG